MKNREPESTTFDPERIQEFAKLLARLRRIPAEQTTSYKTFLEICDDSRRERVYSNILAYFLNPMEEHGLGDLFPRSLSAALPPEEAAKLNRSEFRTVKVKLEERTVGSSESKMKRIDLVVDGETFLIGIENKIGAPLNNPLNDYKIHLDELASSSVPKKPVVRIVLSVNPLKNEQRSDCNREGFSSILYGTFLEKLQQNFGAILHRANNRSITGLVDFINSIYHLQKGSRMNEHLLHFFRDHQPGSIDFYQKAQQLNSEMHQRVLKVTSLVNFSAYNKKPRFYSSMTDVGTSEIYCLPVKDSSTRQRGQRPARSLPDGGASAESCLQTAVSPAARFGAPWI